MILISKIEFFYFFMGGEKGRAYLDGGNGGRGGGVGVSILGFS